MTVVMGFGLVVVPAEKCRSIRLVRLAQRCSASVPGERNSWWFLREECRSIRLASELIVARKSARNDSEDSLRMTEFLFFIES